MNKAVKVSDSLYETDYFLWLEKQAIAIRKRDVGGLDWDNLLEELEYLGREQVNAVNSLLKQIIIHRLKLDYTSEIYSRHHWKCEINAFIDDLEDKLTNAILNKVDQKKFGSAIETTKFDILKKKEENEGFVEAVYSRKDGKTKKFFNLGKKNNYKELIKPQTAEAIERLFRKEMEELGYL